MKKVEKYKTQLKKYLMNRKNFNSEKRVRIINLFEEIIEVFELGKFKMPVILKRSSAI